MNNISPIKSAFSTENINHSPETLRRNGPQCSTIPIRSVLVNFITPPLVNVCETDCTVPGVLKTEEDENNANSGTGIESRRKNI